MGSAVNGYAFALITAIVIIIADIFLKVAADRGYPLYHHMVVTGCVLYLLSALLWFGAMQHVALAQAGIAYSMFSLLALAAIGVFWFDEPLGVREVGGIGCALLAMLLMVRVA
jgi:drug/metabolite transporter (DMT)-like permease